MTTNLGVLLTAGKVVTPFDKEVRESLAGLAKPPTLVAILSTSASASRMYANFAQAQCENIGVRFVLKEVGAGKWKEGDEGEKGGEGEGVEEAIVEANEDEECDGIIVFYPIFGGRQVSLSFGPIARDLSCAQDHYLQQAGPFTGHL
jgi:methylenetetrahydrofolate dehydrogenase (NAD+)